MKRDRLFSLLWAVVLSFCIAFGGLQCMITAFSFQTDTQGLAFFCVVFAIIAALVSMTRWGNWIFAVVLFLLGVHLWRDGSLEASVEALLYQISQVYDMAYGWGKIYWSPKAPTVMHLGPALSTIAVLLIWAVTWTVIRREHSIFSIVIGMLPLCACLVVTDRVPSTDSLFLLIFGFLLLILTQTVRRQKETDGNRLTVIMLIPALLCTTLLFYCVPKDNYQQPQSVPGWIEGLFSGISLGTGGQGVAPNISLDLSKVGPKRTTGHAVMEITAERSGVLYLRRQSYDAYDGTSWSVSDKVSVQDRYWPTTGLADGGSLSLKLRTDLSLTYLPYYTDLLQQMEYGRLENEFGKNYTLQWMIPGSNASIGTPVRQDSLVRQCLRLPDSTAQQAKQILQRLGIAEGSSDEETANRIAEYVKSIAVYDLKTEIMPQDETDFALWFLERGETGYCIHFATAATVLLRAAGVPARYVTGYMTTVEDGVKKNVVAAESHAWVEYLDSTRGWTVLDPTPPAPDPDVTEPTKPTEGTEPTEDTEPTQAPTVEQTLPSESRDPTEGTTSDTTLPGTTTPVGGADAPKKDLTLLWNCLMAVAYAALAVILLWGQYLLRIQLRRKKMHTGSPNQRALACWKEIVRLSRLYRQPLSEEMEMLAEKAKFSQHTLSAAEVKAFKTRLRELSRLLAEKPWYQRLVFKLLFAAE